MHHVLTMTWRLPGTGLLHASQVPNKTSISGFLLSCTRTQACQLQGRRSFTGLAVSSRSNAFNKSRPVAQDYSRTPYKQHAAALAWRNTSKWTYGFVRHKSTKGHQPELHSHPESIRSLSAREVQTLFGPQIPIAVGNRVLKTLQKQRVAGTLDHDLEEPTITEFQTAKALSYLRKRYPLDEDAAIMRRFEREEQDPDPTKDDIVINQYLSRAEKLGIYKPQASAEIHGVYGRSELEEIRKKNEAEWQEELDAKQKEAEEEELALPADTQKPAGKGKAIAHKYKPKNRISTERKEWVKEYERRAQLSKFAEPPKMSYLQRLGPSWIFAISCTIGAVIFSMLYEPPKSTARMFPDIPPAAATIVTLMALNVNLWLAWKIPQLWRFMNKYCMMIVAIPKPVSALGNVFSHQSVTHLGGNMLALWFIGTRLHDEIGRGNFMAIYLSSGILASVATLTAHVLNSNLRQASLGASGAIAGLIGCYLLLHFNDRLELIFWPWDHPPSISGGAILGFLVLSEAVAVVRGLRTSFSSIDNLSHLFGLGVGISGGWALKQKAQAKRGQLVNVRANP